MTATPETLAAAARWRAEAKKVQRAIYAEEVAAVEARNGELHKRGLTELQQLRQQIEAARIEKQAAKDTLVALRDTKQAEKAALQAQLDAAVGATAKNEIRVQIDAVNAAIDKARQDLDFADAALTSLRIARDEALLEERITKNELLPEDAAKVAERKARQAKDCDDKRAWLARQG